MNRPQATNEIVIERVQPQRGGLVAGPFEFGIIVLDGQITDIFTEGRRPVARGGVLGVGRRADARTYIAYIRPFDLAFWLKDPDDYMSTDDGITLNLPVLTADGQIVAARVALTLSVMRDRIDSLLLLLGQLDQITALDLANVIKHEMSAKVLSLNLSAYTAAELRGNEHLLRQMTSALERELSSTISGYGLSLTNFNINWGLTAEERERIKQQKHASRIRDIQRDQELRDAQPSFTAETILSRPAPAPTLLTRPRQPRQRPATRPSPTPSRPRSTPAPAATAVQGYCYVYTDIPTRMSRIHKSTCYYYKNRATARRDDNWWHGPYDSLQQAKQNLDAQHYVRVCKVCNP